MKEGMGMREFDWRYLSAVKGLADGTRGEWAQPSRISNGELLLQNTQTATEPANHPVHQHPPFHPPLTPTTGLYTAAHSLDCFLVHSMAPRTRSKRTRDNTTTLHPSIEAASDDVRPLSDGDKLDGDHESKITGRATDDPQSEEMETPAPQSWALVLGEQMLVPRTYNPDTYDPDGRMPWTPEPEPYSPQTYAAWGRKHFGEEWYELRKTMLEERNIYRRYDPVYKKRQRDLRIMEHKIERRPFEPGLQSGEIRDAGWVRLWARLSKDLGIEVSSDPASPTSSNNDNDNDSATDLSGFNTYEPTPEPREPTPIPHDHWERLEFNRRRHQWGEERYHFERIFLKERLIDGARTVHEDRDGDGQREKELEEIEKVLYVPGTLIKPSGEYEHRMRNFNLRAEGWTQEQIDAKDRAEYAAGLEMASERNERRNTAPKNQEEMNLKFRVWDHSGISREEQDRLGHMYGFSERPPNPYLFRAPKEKRPRPKTQEEMNELFRRWDYKLNRMEQNELARMYGFGPLRELDMPPRSQEEMNSKFELWEGSGISREEQDRLGRMYGFSERPPTNTILMDSPMEKRLPPRNQEEMDQLFRFWKWTLSRTEQNELARMYGFGPRQAGTDRYTEGGLPPQAQASPPRPAKDTRARGSRATKNAPQRRSPRPARSRRSAPTTAEALPPDRRPRPSKSTATEELSNKAQVIPQGHRRQRRVYQKERESRRLAGQLPEFGLLGETQSLYDASLQLSKTRKRSSTGARNNQLPTKPTAKGAKPQGISKHGRVETSRSKKSVRGVRS